MEITEVKVTKVQRENSKTRGYASVVIEGCFRVNDIKILSGDNGLFIGMPSKKRGDINRDIAHPLNQETRDKFVKAILEEYEKTE